MNIPEIVYTKLAETDDRFRELEQQLEYARSIEDTDQIDILEHEFFSIVLEKLGVNEDIIPIKVLEPKLLPDLIQE